MGYLKNKQLVNKIECFYEAINALYERYDYPNTPPGTQTPAIEDVLRSLAEYLYKGFFELEKGSVSTALENLGRFFELGQLLKTGFEEDQFRWQYPYLAHEVIRLMVQVVRDCEVLQAKSPLLAYNVSTYLKPFSFMIDRQVKELLTKGVRLFDETFEITDDEKAIARIIECSKARVMALEIELSETVRADLTRTIALRNDPNQIVSNSQLKLIRTYRNGSLSETEIVLVEDALKTQLPGNLKSLHCCLNHWEMVIQQCEVFNSQRHLNVANDARVPDVERYLLGDAKNQIEAEREKRFVLNPIEADVHAILQYYQLRIKNDQADAALIQDVQYFLAQVGRSTRQERFSKKLQVTINTLRQDFKRFQNDERNKVLESSLRIKEELFRYGVTGNRVEGKKLRALKYRERARLIDAMETHLEEVRNSQTALVEEDKLKCHQRIEAFETCLRKLKYYQNKTNDLLYRNAKKQMRGYIEGREENYAFHDRVQNELSFFAPHNTDRMIRRAFVRDFSASLKDFLYDSQDYPFFELLEKGKQFRRGWGSHRSLAAIVESIEREFSEELGEKFLEAKHHVETGLNYGR